MTDLRLFGRRGDLVARYASVFAGKGIDLDPKLARRALDGHFATRYRTVKGRTGRTMQIFEEAIRTSLELMPATGGTGGEASPRPVRAPWAPCMKPPAGPGGSTI
jgi:hypothetical protein